MNGAFMKRVIVCYKWLLDGADIRVNEQSRELELGQAKWTLNEFDRNAIEAGVQIKAATPCELIGLTAGVDTAPSTKDALSRGLDSVSFLNSAVMAEADSGVTAKVLAAMIRQIGGADVVLCSEGSNDEYAQQTSGRLAALLGYASVSYVSAIEVAADVLKLSRKLDDGIEVVEVSGPVVISVVPDINTPPIPSVKSILGAKKKPSLAVALDAIGLPADACQVQLATVSVLAPEVKRKKIHLNPDGVSLPDAAARLVQQLDAEGVL
jgi:electron transfer flavoprotein beta subunit